MVCYTQISTPLGPLTIIAIHQEISQIYFGSEIDATITYHPTLPSLQLAAQQLQEYFYHNRKHFTFPITFKGTPFQQLVWTKLAKIPYGETWSYQQLAQKVGRPKAARAVGGACHNNPIGIVLACHRVIGSNGKLVGYAGGLRYKEWLLAHEKTVK